MPTTADLDRLRALVERLTPLAAARPGEPVESEGWNTVVGAVIEIARSVLAQEPGQAVPPHTHVDQVKSSWLDPALRAIVERGGLADPASARNLLKLEQSVRRLDERVRGVDGGLGDVRDRISDFASRDLVREAEVTRLRRGLDSVGLAPEELRDLRRSLDAISAEVTTAVSAAQRLTVDGEPADLDALNDRIRTLESLREGLVGADGQLLNAGDLERRLTELTNTLVTESELDEALASRPVTVPEERVDALADTLRADLRSSFAADLAAVETNIRNETNARFSDVEALVARRVSEATPALEARIRQQVTSEIATANSQLREEVLAETDRRRATAIENLDARLATRVDALQSNLAASVRAQLDQLLPARLQAFEARLDNVVGRLSATETQIGTVEQAIAATDRRLAEETRSIRQQIGGVRDSLRQELNELRVNVDRDRQLLENRLVESTNARIEARTTALADTLRTEFRRRRVIDLGGGGVVTPVDPIIRGPR